MASNLKERIAAAQAAGAAPNEALAPIFGDTSGTASSQRVEKLLLSLLEPWSSSEYDTQPFQLYTPQKMQDLMTSMADRGLLSPIIVRPLNGRYQIVAGHNRVISAQRLGWETIDALVKHGMTDADAADVMVDTNFNQRDTILPSERAWGWKIKMDNLRHQGTSSHDGTKLRSDTQVGAAEGKGRSTIQRYISLTRLIRPLLDIVDGYQYGDAGTWELIAVKPMIPLTAAEQLVTLSSTDQKYLVFLFEEREIRSIAKRQADELKAMRTTTPPGEDMAQKTIRRCLGLDTADEKPAKPCVLKIALPSFAVKYNADPEFHDAITKAIENFVLERNHKNE